MPQKPFIHLRTHSAYSLLEGALTTKDIVGLCLRKNMPAVAVTDTQNLFGSLEFSIAASSSGVQPIIGALLNIEYEKPQSGSHFLGKLPTAPVLCLAQNEQGYLNLLHLLSESYLETSDAEEPHITLDNLFQHNQGLILLSGGIRGPLGQLLLQKKKKEAKNFLEACLKTFQDRFYMEVSRLGFEEENELEPQFLDLAYELNIPLVATNEAFFADTSYFEAHDALICIAEGRYVLEQDRKRLTDQHYFKSTEEMRELFSDLPEAIENTSLIAQRCGYMPEVRDPILPACPKIKGQTEEEALREMAEKGLDKRLQEHVFEKNMTDEQKQEAAQPYRDRLKFEFDTIKNMGFLGYFLIVADFIQWAKAENIPVGPGRGSGAGSVVAWALSITDLDPLRWGLLFERFLNPERVSMPDFDIDFCQDRRDEVIHYVQDQYGKDRVAQIITFGKLQARAVLRDVGRVLQMPYGQVDKICRLVPNNPANPTTLQEAIDAEPLFQRMCDEEEVVGKLLEVSLKLEGLYRHASTHAAGVVIGDRPLKELVPLYRDPRSTMPVTQFNMKMVEKAGLVKFDFLGLKTLTVLSETLELIQDKEKPEDLSKIPLEHKPTYDMLSKGDTVGVFQLESSGMRDVLKRLKPDRFEDIIAVVALYRPGPMDNIPSYIACKHGLEEPDYLHPSLEGILKETFGIMIYQEQVMQIAQTLSGYSLGSADLLRRAMGKKIKEEMEAQRKTFIEGAVGKGVDEAKASQIFEQVNKFAGYGFNKSHAAAYALVAYQTAYLKSNYPVEFFAASMTLDLGNTDKLCIFKQELKRIDIPLLPPDVNKSDPIFAVEEHESKKGIRYALAAVKGLGRQAMEALVEERQNNGPFKNMYDFVTRLDSTVINKRQLEGLITSGALDNLHPNRAQLFNAVEMMIYHAQESTRQKQSSQALLFVEEKGEIPSSFRLPEMKDWSTNDRLQKEFDAIGFYLSAHPLEAYTDQLKEMGVIDFEEVIEKNIQGSVKLAAMMVSLKERRSSKGNKWGFLGLTDISGSFDVTVFSEVLIQSRAVLEEGKPLIVDAEVQVDQEGIRLTAQRIISLDQALDQSLETVFVHIEDEKSIDEIANVIINATPGRTSIHLTTNIDIDGTLKTVEISIPQRISLSLALKDSLEQLGQVTLKKTEGFQRLVA